MPTLCGCCRRSASWPFTTTYTFCVVPFVLPTFMLLQQALWEHSWIQVHRGKTQLWNRAREVPRGWRALTAAARLVDPDAVVWRGDPEQAIVGADPSDPRSAKCVVGAAFAQVLGQITCSEWSLRIVRKISQLNTTRPCGSDSPKFLDVTCPTPRVTSLSCLSPLGALVCAVHVESPPCWHSPGRMSWKMPSRGLFRQCTVAAPLASRALFGSQGGPVVGLPFSCAPTARHSRFDLQLFQVLLLRRLWLPLPPSDRYCRCGLPLDPRGHHRAACATARVLGRVWREAGAKVSSNVTVHGDGPGSTRRSRQSAIGDCC